MPNLDWKNIVNKVLGWGFPAVFCLLGIVLLAINKKINVPVYWGFGSLVLGVIVYVVSLLLETKASQLAQDNKALMVKVDNLTEKVEELNKELEASQTMIDYLKKELSDKKRKAV